MARPPRTDQGGFAGWELERGWDMSTGTTTRARELVVVRYGLLVLLDPVRALNELTRMLPEAQRLLPLNIEAWQERQDRETDLLARRLEGRIDRPQGRVPAAACLRT